MNRKIRRINRFSNHSKEIKLAEVGKGAKV